MAVAHLTDEEIQAFLDSKQSLDSSTAQHVGKCDACSERQQQYKLLYRELNRQPVINLSKHFEDTVLQKVGLLPQSAPGFRLWQWILFVAVFIAGSGISLIFIGMDTLLQIQTTISNMITVTGKGLGRVRFLQQNFNLFLLSMLVVSAISLLDRIYITRLRR